MPVIELIECDGCGRDIPQDDEAFSHPDPSNDDEEKESYCLACYNEMVEIMNEEA